MKTNTIDAARRSQTSSSRCTIREIDDDHLVQQIKTADVFHSESATDVEAYQPVGITTVNMKQQESQQGGQQGGGQQGGGGGQSSQTRMISIRHVEKKKQRRKKEVMGGGGGTQAADGGGGQGAQSGLPDGSKSGYKHEGDSVNTEQQFTKQKIEYFDGGKTVGHYDRGKKDWLHHDGSGATHSMRADQKHSHIKHDGNHVWCDDANVYKSKPFVIQPDDCS
jgi:hypothetical protein